MSFLTDISEQIQSINRKLYDSTFRRIVGSLAKPEQLHTYISRLINLKVVEILRTNKKLKQYTRWFRLARSIPRFKPVPANAVAPSTVSAVGALDEARALTADVSLIPHISSPLITEELLHYYGNPITPGKIDKSLHYFGY